MDKKIEQAVKLVDDILAQRGGSDLMHIGSIYYGLTECEMEDFLTKEDLMKLTERLVEACGASTVPLLTAERVDAVRYMLEYGISENRSPEFMSISAEKAKELLLTCDMEVFTDLVDAVAIDGHDYYSADLDFLNKEVCERVNRAIGAVQGEKPPLENVMKEAADIAAAQEPVAGRIWLETEQQYL